jgi:hypothetical protein
VLVELVHTVIQVETICGKQKSGEHDELGAGEMVVPSVLLRVSPHWDKFKADEEVKKVFHGHIHG